MYNLSRSCIPSIVAGMSQLATRRLVSLSSRGGCSRRLRPRCPEAAWLYCDLHRTPVRIGNESSRDGRIYGGGMKECTSWICVKVRRKKDSKFVQ
jgi:hypothetical protein